MDDLIYKFLLQSEYPRRSIILNIDVVGPLIDGGNDGYAPAFIIVEPDTADVLAVIDVATAVNAEELEMKALDLGHYARTFCGEHALGFLFCMDPDASSEQEQVQVYRVLRSAGVQLLSMQNFPNFTALRVSRKLAGKTSGEANSLLPVPVNGHESKTIETGRKTHESNCPRAIAVYFYLSALLLVMAMVADKLYLMYVGEPLLTTAQSILTIGAALLFSLPAAVCCIEQALVRISNDKQI